MQAACEVLIQQNFETILNNDEGSKFLLNLPMQYVKTICSSNSLNITDEMLLVKLFEKYLAHRDELPLLKEEDPSQDWSILNEEERKARTEAKSAADLEAKAKKDEEAKAKEDAYNALTPEQRYNRDW